ncbi:MAG: hypothetical protein M3505_06870, partial [Verrucomicrobiota bacterium]|nr:hypothetical protein [Verrucomicrobiota bacterium]
FELDHPASPGGRHEQIKRLVCSLTAAGTSAAEIFTMLRSRYAADVEDGEIHELIYWASTKHFTRAACGIRRQPPKSPYVAATQRQLVRPKKATGVASVDAPAAEQAARDWLKGFSAGPEDFFERSPLRLHDDWRDAAAVLFDVMYRPEENINVVAAHIKGKPVGRGLTKVAREWMREAQARQLVCGDAGAWIRMNPTDGHGMSDSNITAYRFALIESDKLSLGLQFAMYARLPLPINALISSGGKSIHAWIRVDAPSAEEYRRRLKVDIFPLLAPFGFDRANTNPSRLARLPGVTRKFNSTGTGEQRLIYCAPDAREFRPIL